MGCTPIIAACDGEYAIEPRKNVMIWNLPPVDSSNKNGALEFSTSNARPADFFPVAVSFHYDGSYARLKVSLPFLNYKFLANNEVVFSECVSSVKTGKYQKIRCHEDKSKAYQKNQSWIRSLSSSSIFQSFDSVM